MASLRPYLSRMMREYLRTIPDLTPNAVPLAFTQMFYLELVEGAYLIQQYLKEQGSSTR